LGRGLWKNWIQTKLLDRFKFSEPYYWFFAQFMLLTLWFQPDQGPVKSLPGEPNKPEPPVLQLEEVNISHLDNESGRTELMVWAKLCIMGLHSKMPKTKVEQGCPPLKFWQTETPAPARFSKAWISLRPASRGVPSGPPTGAVIILWVGKALTNAATRINVFKIRDKSCIFEI